MTITYAFENANSKHPEAGKCLFAVTQTTRRNACALQTQSSHCQQASVWCACAGQRTQTTTTTKTINGKHAITRLLCLCIANSKLTLSTGKCLMCLCSSVSMQSRGCCACASQTQNTHCQHTVWCACAIQRNLTHTTTKQLYKACNRASGVLVYCTIETHTVSRLVSVVCCYTKGRKHLCIARSKHTL